MEAEAFNIGTIGVVAALISSIAAILMAASAIRSSAKLTPREAAREDAIASKTYAETAVISEKRAQELSVRLEAMEELFDEQAEIAKEALGKLAEWSRGLEIILYQAQNANMTLAWTPSRADLDKFKEMATKVKVKKVKEISQDYRTDEDNERA